jgi:superfamily I DNA/RNA helicase
MASTLNPQQEKAVTTVAGPVLVLAGAGTGKTRVVTERIAHLLKHERVRPDRIIAVTFTNKAAGEMTERLARLLGRRQVPRGLVVSTFHSLCNRMLRRDAERLGYSRNFSICDAGDQVALVRRALRNVAGVKKKRPEDILSIISRLKTDGVDPRACERTAVEDDDHAVAVAYRRYQEGLRAADSMDFDDLLVNALALLREHEEVRGYWQDRAAHLLVDEFQDTSAIQFDLLGLLSAKHGNLCVVGDDDQSIYSWRGARPRNIVQFETHFPGATVVRLEENYRSVESILKAANALIAKNEVRVGKTLWSRLGAGDPVAILEAEDEEEEAERVVKRIFRAIDGGDRPGEHAILLRTNAQTRGFEEHLRAYRLPYVVIGGQSFYDRKEVRDVLAYLTAADNPAAEAALRRIINVPARGLGPKSVERLVGAARGRNRPLGRILPEAANMTDLPRSAREGAVELDRILARIRQRAQAGEWAGLVDGLLRETGYAGEVESMYDDPLTVSSRLDAARDVGRSLETFRQRNPEAGLSDFLQEAALVRDADTERDKKAAADAVRLITLHSAKGLEFPHVVLAGMQEGMLPHKNAVEDGDVSEERRLAYVGFTRARQTLTVSYARSRTIRGRTQPAKPSRFLEEIPPELLDRSAGGDARQEAAQRLRAMRQSLEGA